MEKLFKICCVAGLSVSLLFVSACNEEQAPAPKQTKQPQVVSKPISKSNAPAKQTSVPVDTGKKQAPASDLKLVQDSEKAGHIRGNIDDAAAWHLDESKLEGFMDSMMEEMGDLDEKEDPRQLASIFRAAPVGIGVVRDRRLVELNEDFIKGMLKDPKKEYFAPTPEWDNERAWDRLWSFNSTPERGPSKA